MLGIQFDQTLCNKECNYEKCLKSMRDELNSWRFRHPTIVGKITVIKTFCLPEVMHIASVIPRLCLTKLNEVEKEWKAFIKLNSSHTVDKETRYLPKKNEGLGMLRLYVFWRSVRMSWLRCLVSTNST